MKKLWCLLLLTACQQTSLPTATNPILVNFSLSDGSTQTTLVETAQRGVVILDHDLRLKLESEIVPTANTANVTRGSTSLWPEGKVYYLFDASVTAKNRAIFLSAVQSMEARTPIRFFERTTEKNHIRVFEDQDPGSCWSYLGMTGGSQDLDVFCNANVGTVIHELGHALGLFHEHSRLDRDGHVQVRWENIHEVYRSAFRKMGYSNLQPTPYDHKSIMHYGAYAFSKNGQVTLQPIQPGVSLNDLGQRQDLSDLDIQGIKALYGTPMLTAWSPVFFQWISTQSQKATTNVYNRSARPATITGIQVDHQVVQSASIPQNTLQAGTQQPLHLVFQPCSNTSLDATDLKVTLQDNPQQLQVQVVRICQKDQNTPAVKAIQGGGGEINVTWALIASSSIQLQVKVQVEGKDRQVIPNVLTSDSSKRLLHNALLVVSPPPEPEQEVCVTLEGQGHAGSSCFTFR